MLALGIWLVGGPAWSTDLGDAARRAERLAAERRTTEAFEALDEARSALWASQNLTIVRAALVDDVAGYGIYTPRANRPALPGDSVILYAEPVSYGYRRQADGRYRITLDADVSVELETGQVIAEGLDIFAFDTLAPRPLKAFHVALSFRLPDDLKPGAYRIVLTLRDRHGGGGAETALPIEIVAEGQEAANR